MDIVTIITLIIGFAAIGGLIFYLNKQNSQNKNIDIIEKKLNEMFPNLLQNANAQLITMANEKLGAEKKAIETDLINKKDAIEGLVKKLQDEIKEHNQKLETAELKREGSYSKIVQAITQQQEEMGRQREVTQSLSEATHHLKNLLSNNQKLGHFGEQVAEDLLKMAGFVIDTDYHKQKAGSDSSRPDFTVLLPDGSKINVDAKFPFQNLQKMLETQDKAGQETARRDFEKDVKEKIKQVSTRNYIDPESNTVDFAILFIPNEMIFSYIYQNMQEIWQTAITNKVILAGPFNFTAIIRMIRQSYTTFNYQKNITGIINLVKEFEKQFALYNVEFEKIGKNIETLSKQYQTVNTTRSNQLTKVVEKIKLSDAGESAGGQNNLLD